LNATRRAIPPAPPAAIVPPAADAWHEAGSGEREHADWRAWLLPIFALACWALLIRHLSAEWTLNEQYQFGWLVPLLTAYLLKVRAERPPTPQPAANTRLADFTLLALAVASALVMPIREANLDWRLVEWSLAAIAIAASLLCFWRAGGWPWARHFAFPLFFFLIAVPLPRNLEYPWMDRLMLNNANVSVELLHWLGADAVAHGNLIQLATGTLGVDEACSGIRSLQSTLMLSLFLGEILALSWLRRAVLLGAGLGWALVTNIGRTTFLGIQAARDGLGAVDRWHDIAGFSVLALCAVTVSATAWLLHRTLRRRDSAPREVPFALGDFVARLRPAAAFGGVALAVLVAGLVFTKVWFDYHARSFALVTDWEFRLPAQRAAFREEAIPPRTRKILNYDEGYTGKWTGDARERWQAFYFRWLPGRTVTQSSRVHDPRICLGRAGMELVNTLPPVTFERGDVALAFDSYHFRDGGQDLFVFNCLAEDVRSATGLRRALEQNSPRERLAAALAGRRQAGQRRVQVAVWDTTDPAHAAQEFHHLLESQIALADRTAQR
jgi:exosortase